MPAASTNEALALEIILALQDRGHLAYLVGGCVRDRLLAFHPKDFDVCTDATPPQLIEYFPRSEKVGAHFGVILVKSNERAAVEVATFRSDRTYSDGRRPDAVQFEHDPRQDALRRDFTINALMEDPATGTILDFASGRDDLARGLIRAIGDPEVRFREDHLRMLRAVRFAARFAFQIDARTADAIQRLAPYILKISAERIRDELGRILTEGNAGYGLTLLDELHLLQYLLPEVKAFQGVEQPPEFHPEGDVWQHVLLMLGKLDHPALTLALGVLLHDVGKPATFRVADRIRFDGHAEVGAEMTRSILSRLRFSSDQIEQVTALVANHMKFKDVQQMRTSTLKRFLRLPQFEEHMALHQLDCLASHGHLNAYEFVQQKQSEFQHEPAHPPRLVTGDDLISLGYQPGPGFSRALEAIETGQLEGTIHSPEDAVAVARSVLDEHAAIH